MKSFYRKEFDYRKILWRMLSDPGLTIVEADIIDHISAKGFDKKLFTGMLARKGYSYDAAFKEEFVRTFLVFVKHILVDRIISEDELTTAGLLKLLFKIDASDLLPKHTHYIEQIFDAQLNHVKEENPGISFPEACHKAGLQELFSLGYDEYIVLCKGH
ncbi:MAG: hypothetical protein EOO09_20570 [Chitinophagaceae bacterium]|nr:MAG: hypothetical protein EOO09_20570 [Chitinophagaceae bacterium]